MPEKVKVEKPDIEETQASREEKASEEKTKGKRGEENTEKK